MLHYWHPNLQKIMSYACIMLRCSSASLATALRVIADLHGWPSDAAAGLIGEGASAAGCCRVLRGHRGSVLALLALGSLLISGGRSGLLRVWDLEALVCRRTLTGHHADVLSMAALATTTECEGAASPPDNGHQAAPLVGHQSTLQPVKHLLLT